MSFSWEMPDNLPAIPDSPVTRDEFNHLSAIVAELRNKVAALEIAVEDQQRINSVLRDGLQCLVKQQWGAGG